ncbi:MAG: hypothetical protein J07HB67_00267 [halophilic archaeon J07HB67]|jgi:hypothetical protein|nr:MAG: hypothetical protein J07HB67_00267 [halophilic archaeon J07HB67]
MATTGPEDNESFGVPNPLGQFHEAGCGESTNEFYETLSSERRRELLYLLWSVDADTLDLSELASIVAAWEKDIDDPATVTYDDRKSIQTAISQHHVPKLADAGLVDYDEETNRLTLAVEPTSLRLPELPPSEGDHPTNGLPETGGTPVGPPAGGTSTTGTRPPTNPTTTDGIGVDYRTMAAIAGLFAVVGVVIGVRVTDVWPLLVVSSGAAGALVVAAYRDWQSAR